MASRVYRQKALISVAGAALLAASATASFAQQTGKSDVEEVVVTGTLIRGIAPPGANVVGISKDAIDLSGVTDANQLLGQLVPQSNFFLANPQPGEGNALGITRVPLNRPNLRDLPNTNTGSGQPTLVLMDGHRVVPAGIDLGLVVDPGIFPTAGLDRIESILDGASAIYGSDAVGGVLNYITKKRSNDKEATITYGFADGYWSTSANVTTGWTWDKGGIGIGYSYEQNSILRNADRSYTQARNWLQGAHQTGLACDAYNTASITGGVGATAAQAGAVRYTISGTSTPTFTLGPQYCQANADASLFPAQLHHGGQVTISQDITDFVKFDMSAFYGFRKTTQDLGPFEQTVSINTRNPYYTPIPGQSATATQSIALNYGSVLGYQGSQTAKTIYQVGQLNPEFTIDIGKWQVRPMFSYGHSMVSVDQISLNTTLQSNYITGPTGSTAAIPANLAIDPYIPTATTTQSLFSDLLWDNYRQGITNFYEAQVVADGPLFTIPGGEVRSAIGAEWSKTSLRRRVTDTGTRILGPYTSASSSNKSVFGELNIPIVGASNSMTGIQSLQLSVSGRYDSYADFGNTFNPKVAVTYEPVDWLTLRGNWNKSYRAPNALDKLGQSGNVLFCVGSGVPGCTNAGAVQLPVGYSLPAAGTNVFFTLSGTSNGVRPEHSSNYSIGGDIRPPISFLDGLVISPSYWQVNFKDYISSPTTGSLAPIFASAPQLVLLCINPNGTFRNGGVGCTAAELAAFAAKAPNGGPAAITAVQNSGFGILYLVDTTVTNLGGNLIRGLDLNTKYTRRTGFGSIDANVNAVWRLTNNQAIIPGTVPVDLYATGVPRFRMTASLGANIGDFRAQATLQHQAGYTPNPSTGQCGCQLAIDQFDVLNMSFRYNVNGTNTLLQNLALTLTINNVLDTAPPQSRTGSLTSDTTGSTVASTPDGGAAATLGRFVQFSIDKKF